jgi:hypothetical protein
MALQNILFRYVLLLITLHFHNPESALIVGNAMGILIIWLVVEFVFNKLVERESR